MTKPFAFLAARPAVWVNDLSFLKNPSLSASRMATRDTSGKSSPSRSKFTPTNTSNPPILKSLNISTRSIVSTSECINRTLICTLLRYFVSSSAIRFVSVVTKTLSFRSTLLFISSNKSSI